MTLSAIVISLLLLAVIYLMARNRRSRFELAAARTQHREYIRQIRAHQAYIAALEPLRAMGGVAYNALLIVDSAHRVLYLNTAAQELFGSEHPDSSDYNTAIALTRSHEIDDLIAQTLREPEGEMSEQIEVNSCTYRIRSQRVVIQTRAHVVLALEDISELQRLGRARREFVANISHELRTPITSIRLLVDTLLRSRGADPDAERTTLRKIAAETEVLHQMAQELLDIAMIESGRAEFILRPTPLTEIVETAITLFTERAHRKQLEICNEVSGSYTVLADREQLRRVVSNLLHNAIKFTPHKGTITVNVTQSSEWVIVSVTDTGPGIPPHARERIFERFYRADQARHTEGTGLGLAIAKHIVHAHGGLIWAEDPPKPPGACIRFRIPRA